MSSPKIKVLIDDFLEEIMPDFLVGLQKEISVTEMAFKNSDLSKISQFGHKLKGNAPCYGLNELGEIGYLLETEANSQNMNDCLHLFNKIKDYLERLEIIFKKSE